MTQRIAIILDGKGKRIPPVEFARLILCVAESLPSIDANMWQLGHPRYEWTVTELKKTNPGEAVLEGERVIDSSDDPDVVGAWLTGCEQLERGERPLFFKNDDLERAAQLGDIYKNKRVKSVVLQSNGTTYSPTAKLRENARNVIGNIKSRRFTEYGSIRGTVRQVTNDKREGHQKSEVQIIDDNTNQVVICVIPPSIASNIGKHLDGESKLEMFGEVKYIGDYVPERITIESFRSIPPSSDLPKLEDIHKLQPRIPGGLTVEDLIRQNRSE